MKKCLCLAVLAAAMLLGMHYSTGIGQGLPGAGPGVGQPMPAQASPPPTRTALLDVPFVFKNHIRFKMMMEQLKRDVQQAEADFKAKREQINHMAEELQQFQKGTPQYKEIEEKIADLQARLAVDTNRQKAAFLQQEARNYYAVYQEICQATDAFCRQYGFDLVIRFNRDEANPENPESVLASINRPVVWQRGLDITQNIVDELNRNAPANNPGTAARPAMPYGNQQR
ncbi:MAG: OmpH family outer membrane protein [Thermoguttaceae bacterium]